jgi:hypothetical protein
MRTKKQIPITLDGSGNGSAVVGVPTSRLVGVFFDLGAGLSSCPYTVASMGRTIIGETITSDTFRNVDELLRKADGTASTAYGTRGAIVHDTVTVTVTGGTASKSLTVTLFLEG